MTSNTTLGASGKRRGLSGKTSKGRGSAREGHAGSRLGWLLVLVATFCLLAIAAVRDSGPRTPDERIQSIAERIACPICEGESVAESRNPTSDALLERIKIDVRAGQMSDEEIIYSITSAREGQELLVPRASGIEALAWALPAAAAAIGLVGLGLAFARWRREAAAVGTATADDYELVADALEQGRVRASGTGDSEVDDSGGGPCEPSSKVAQAEPNESAGTDATEDV